MGTATEGSQAEGMRVWQDVQPPKPEELELRMRTFWIVYEAEQQTFGEGAML